VEVGWDEGSVSGEGRSIKGAEVAAAKLALEAMEGQETAD
jgi:dsRNA-specific ribonuclease